MSEGLKVKSFQTFICMNRNSIHIAISLYKYDDHDLIIHRNNKVTLTGGHELLMKQNVEV